MQSICNKANNIDLNKNTFESGLQFIKLTSASLIFIQCLKDLGFLRNERTCQKYIRRLEFFLNLFVSLGFFTKIPEIYALGVKQIY